MTRYFVTPIVVFYVCVSGEIGARVESSFILLPTQRAALLESPYDRYINKHASTHGIDLDLVRAVMATESSFNPKAVSHKGARGLMQLVPATAKRFGVANSFDVDQNIEGGVKYLKFLLEMFDYNVQLTLAAYNAGENAVKRAGGVPNYRETINYVRKITARYGTTYQQPTHELPAWIYTRDGKLTRKSFETPRGVVYSSEVAAGG